MLAGISNYGDRITAGKRVEHAIVDQLRKKGFTIEDPTPGQDMHEKIDGFWVDKKQNKYPLQIKFRETGDDIIFELIKDVDRKIDGRDLKTKAVLYLVADRQGVTRMFLTKPIKDKAQEILKTILAELENNPNKANWEGPHWQAKLQVDRAHGQRKIMAYFNPKMFSALGTWYLNIH
jgi:hypothetical protein